MRNPTWLLPLLLSAFAVPSGAQEPSLLLAPTPPEATAHPEKWPAPRWPLPRDAATEARIAALIARMTIEEKIGQIVQADIASVTPEEAKAYHLGSILNGGNSGPGQDDLARAKNGSRSPTPFMRRRSIGPTVASASRSSGEPTRSMVTATSSGRPFSLIMWASARRAIPI